MENNMTSQELLFIYGGLTKYIDEDNNVDLDMTNRVRLAKERFQEICDIVNVDKNAARAFYDSAFTKDNRYTPSFIGMMRKYIDNCMIPKKEGGN